jgi:hypothetical protein
LGACWGVVVLAAEGCGSALARAPWSGTCREEEGEEKGGPSAVFLSSHVARLGSGQRAPGSTAEVSRRMATGFERARTVIFIVNSISLDFRLPGVRRNARKRFKFEILKISTLGDQHTSQGFQ